MSALASSLGALIVATYSTFCKFGFRWIVLWVTFTYVVPLAPTVDGRRPVYLYILPVFVIGSAGVASAQSIPSLLFWRFFQSIGASLGPVIGAAVIGDIYKLEERGSAMGIFFAVCKLFIHEWSDILTYFNRLDWPDWNNFFPFCRRYIFALTIS